MATIYAKEPVVLVTKGVRFSYEHLFEPRITTVNDGKEVKESKQYSVDLLIPKSNTELVAKVQAAIEEAYNIGLKTVWYPKKPALSAVTRFNDGDGLNKNGEERSEAYKGMYFMSVKNNHPVPVWGPNGETIIDTRGNNIGSRDDFYSGCWGNAKIIIKAYLRDNSTPGMSCFVEGILKKEDGEPLAGVKNSAFDDLMDFNDDL